VDPDRRCSSRLVFDFEDQPACFSDSPEWSRHLDQTRAAYLMGLLSPRYLRGRELGMFDWRFSGMSDDNFRKTRMKLPAESVFESMLNSQAAFHEGWENSHRPSCYAAIPFLDERLHERHFNATPPIKHSPHS
jgi:hypothetical protein